MTEQEIQAIEAQTRALLPDDPTLRVPVAVLEIAESQGVKIHFEPLGDGNLHGRMLRQNGSWSIYVHSSDAVERLRYTAAHLLGRLLLGQLDAGGLAEEDGLSLFRRRAHDATGERDLQATQFACSLLMPADALRAAYAQDCRIADLAARFVVGEGILVGRLDQLGLV